MRHDTPDEPRSTTNTHTLTEARAAEAERDAVLVRRARVGDEAAQRELVRTHLRAAFAVARALLTNEADAEDACQDAFAAVFARLDRCKPESSFRPWLLQSVRNRAISLLRQHRVRFAESLGAAPGERDAVAPAWADPAQMAEQRELGRRLVVALEALRPAQREALVLHDVEGWKHDEIAVHLGVRPGTSRSLLFEARRRIRTLLGPAFSPDAP